MAVTVVICSRRDDGDWRDLDLAVRSIQHYTDFDVAVHWQGPTMPNLTGVRLPRQPAGVCTFGAAYAAALQLHDGPVVLANDDIVVRPDTATLLLEDVDHAHRAGPVGFVAARMNYGRRDQLAIGNSKQMVEAACVAPVFAWAHTDTLSKVEWPDCNWYSDDIICWDLKNLGFRHWMSRAYVHHVGERSTRLHGETQDDLNRAGQLWVYRHRPDFVQAQQPG